MNFCENCIHYEMCKTEHESLDGMVLSFFPNNSDCQFFKNKADFVEVVRCKDCAYRYTKYCNAKHERADMDYCSSGDEK